ncbi:MAG: hypothetical protein MJZ76_04610 [Bacteroidales bacterium]|nr:hypothetical protein [Bacteroidales bacterium]
MWWYKIYLYGPYSDSEHHQKFVSRDVFEVPQFDLQSRAAIERIVKMRYYDAVDCDQVQVFFQGQEWRE